MHWEKSSTFRIFKHSKISPQPQEVRLAHRTRPYLFFWFSSQVVLVEIMEQDNSGMSQRAISHFSSFKRGHWYKRTSLTQSSTTIQQCNTNVQYWVLEDKKIRRKRVKQNVFPTNQSKKTESWLICFFIIEFLVGSATDNGYIGVLSLKTQKGRITIRLMINCLFDWLLKGARKKMHTYVRFIMSLDYIG